LAFDVYPNGFDLIYLIVDQASENAVIAIRVARGMITYRVASSCQIAVQHLFCTRIESVIPVERHLSSSRLLGR
jgi:hypothetical protein